jgi:hypothetical protein
LGAGPAGREDGGSGRDDAVDLGAPAAETEEAPAGSEDIDPDMQALADEFAAAGGGASADEEGTEAAADEGEAPAAVKKPAKAEKKGGGLGIGGVLIGGVVGLLLGAFGFYGSMAGGVVDPAMLGLAPASRRRFRSRDPGRRGRHAREGRRGAQHGRSRQGHRRLRQGRR